MMETNNITDNNSDFNFRSLNRKDLMNLSVINNEDQKLRKFKQVDTKRDWSSNLYNLDIEGSFPKRHGVFNQKTNFINKLDDIERTSSKILHYPLNKPEYNLSNSDIKGSSPKCVTFVTKRNFNPLEPKYNLPHVEEIPPPVPKFIRDNINVDGIEGAHPKKYLKWETRNGFDGIDIEGNSPKKPYTRNTKFNNIDYSDVTHDKFKTRRCVNPLDPVYEVKYKNGENFVHGEVEGSKPVTFNPFKYSDPYNLKTLDIDGAQVGTKNAINKYSSHNYNLQLNDIKGARSESLRKGIVTNRMTNPLDPNYQFPGNIELSNGKDSNPYGNTLFSKSANVRQNNGKEVMKNLETVNSNPNINFNQSVSHNIQNENTHPNMNFNNQQNTQFNTQLNMPASSHLNKNTLPSEFGGFNNQVYIDQPIDFDPNLFNKPSPYYGFVHDKYIISSDDALSKLEAKQKENELKNTLSQGGIKNFVGSLNSAISNSKTKNNLSGSKSNFVGKSTANNNSDFYKKSYAQMLDKFIAHGGSL